MSARSQRGNTPTTKRLPTSRLNSQNRTPKQITYDYDAAISQPDVPNFLDFKKPGRSTMVSGAPLKKRTLKTGVRYRVMSRKNFQKRSQTFRPKPAVQKNAKTGSLEQNRTNRMIPSLDVPKEQKDVENEDFDDNDEVENDLSVSRKESETLDEATKERIESIGDNQITGKKVKNQKEEDCDSVATKSPILQTKTSRIPRAKITAGPVHELQSAKKTTNNKLKNSTCLNCTSVNCTPNVLVSEKELQELADKIQAKSGKQDTVRLEEIKKKVKIWNEEETSTTKAEETEDDHGLSSTDESPVISNIDDPRIATILRTLKLNCPCKSCSNHEPPSSSQQEDDSDLKSSPPVENRKKRWLESLKHRKYVETSSDVDVSSEVNSDNDKKKKRNRFKMKNPLIQQVKTSSLMNTSPKISDRRTNFSFLNTLFDIVFWPYLFLKTNR